VDDIEALSKALAEAKGSAEANLAGWQRERADFVNYKRRVEQEREDILKQASASLMLSILPVLDDFERAITCVPPELADHPWVEGTKAIERKLRSILELQGMNPIEALGETFDPCLHDAAMSGKGKEDIVVAELQKGYKLYDKVLRPTKVVVGSGEEEEKEEE
jgi:molecular chaperone GrpE